MVELSLKSTQLSSSKPIETAKRILLVGLCLAIIGLLGILYSSFTQLSLDNPYYLNTTLGEVAVWMSDQSAENEPQSILGQYAQSRVQNDAERLELDILLNEFKSGLIAYSIILLALAGYSSVGYIFDFPYHRWILLVTMVGTTLLLFLFPPVQDNLTVTYILLTIVCSSIVLLFYSTKIDRVIGFLVILALIMVLWESGKSLANRLDYAVTLPIADWTYDSYATLADALNALQSDEIDVVFADRKELDDLMLSSSDNTDSEALAYPDLRYVTDFERESARFIFPIEPALQGRVAVAVLSERANEVRSFTQLEAWRIGTNENSFVSTNYFVEPRELILVDMGIANDLNLPHLQSIAEALLQPARRNGPLLLIRILFGNAMYTWLEAILGFIFGALFGFVLGTLLAHVKLLQRSLLPYVVASQTIPIIALAPMIVIWLRDTNPIIPVAVISAYLTFFPVTINTLRGLQSPDPQAFELMQSYAANRWQILWKLRFPAALPFIFTALKVSATASVVGAIIGELPSGIRHGLGRAILDFSSDYSLISTPKLWGAILIAALVGIVFFLIVVVLELLFVQRSNE